MDPIAWNITATEYTNCQMYMKTLFPLKSKVLREAQLAVIILVGLVSSLGIASNCIVAYLLGTSIKKSPLTILLLGLSISDIIACLHHVFTITLPFLLIYCYDMGDSIRTVWNFKIISITTHLMAFSCNMLYTAAICVLRLIIIVWPIKSRLVITNSRVTIVAFAIWPMSALICMFTALHSLQWLLHGKWDCYLERTNYIYFYVLTAGIPVPVVFICTGFMIFTLFRSRNVPIRKSGQDHFEKITLMLVLIAVLLLVFITFGSLSYSSLRDKFFWLRLPIAQLFSSINSSVNFIIYSTFGKSFRRSVRKLFCKGSIVSNDEEKKIDNRSDSSGNPEF